MALMKKDMGGAANVLGLASMIMETGLKVRLRVLVPAAENAISGRAFRPGDILKSRKGLTVEIGNTDAEGRLVLGDALALADEEAPGLLVTMATLTGAARVALGPDMPAFFTDDSAFASSLEAAAAEVRDPIWRLPLWRPYEFLARLEGRRSQPHRLEWLRRRDRRGAFPAPFRLRHDDLRAFRYVRLEPAGALDRPGGRGGTSNPRSLSLSLKAPWMSFACSLRAPSL